MDRDYDYYQAKIHEAERLRSEALSELLATGWTRTTQFIASIYRSGLGLFRSNHPLHH